MYSDYNLFEDAIELVNGNIPQHSVFSPSVQFDSLQVQRRPSNQVGDATFASSEAIPRHVAENDELTYVDDTEAASFMTEDDEESLEEPDEIDEPQDSGKSSEEQRESAVSSLVEALGEIVGEDDDVDEEEQEQHTGETIEITDEGIAPEGSKQEEALHVDDDGDCDLD